jgi:hypothetical protein
VNAPLAIDLCCGLGGWADGLLVEGWRVVGFDLVRPASFPAGARFVQQDVRTISGVPFRGRVDLIVASPPCSEFTQVWSFAQPRPRDLAGGLDLVRHCVRIAREAGAPFVLENVRGARPYFAPEWGAPTWHVGPYYFWGDAPTLRPMGRFQKGIWGVGAAGAVRWQRHGLARTYRRDKAERAKIPIEIARAVGSQFYPARKEDA